MILSTAHLDTQTPKRYIDQLVSQLGQSLETSIDDNGVGEVYLSDGGGSCKLLPDVTGISLHCEAPTEEQLHRVEDVVGRNLLRFTRDESLTRGWDMV